MDYESRLRPRIAIVGPIGTRKTAPDVTVAERIRVQVAERASEADVSRHRSRRPVGACPREVGPAPTGADR